MSRGPVSRCQTPGHIGTMQRQWPALPPLRLPPGRPMTSDGPISRPSQTVAVADHCRWCSLSVNSPLTRVLAAKHVSFWLLLFMPGWVPMPFPSLFLPLAWSASLFLLPSALLSPSSLSRSILSAVSVFFEPSWTPAVRLLSFLSFLFSSSFSSVLQASVISFDSHASQPSYGLT